MAKKLTKFTKLKPKFYCSNCDKKFRTKFCYCLHLHVHESCKSSWFSCTKCGKKFSKILRLVKHRTIHPPPKVRKGKTSASTKKRKNGALKNRSPNGSATVNNPSKVIKIATKAEDVTTANLPSSPCNGDLSQTEVSDVLFSKPEISDVAQEDAEKPSPTSAASCSELNAETCQDIQCVDDELQVPVISSSNATTNSPKPKGRRTFERYLCANCEEVCTDRASYISHVRVCRRIDGKPKECKLCGRVLVSQRNLRHHINIHCDNDKFACEECGLKYTWKSSLVIHLKSGLCRGPTSETNLNKAVVLNAENESGEIQGLEIGAQNRVTVARGDVHNDDKHEETGGESSETSSGQMSKLRCHSTRARGHCLSIKSEAHDNVEETIDIGDDPSDSFIYPCIDCGKPFKFEDSMWRHYETSHCVMPSGSSHQASGGSQNQVTTSGSKSNRHQCTVCGKTYSRLGHKLEHMAVHTGRKLECGTCGTKFVWSASLRKHQKRGGCVRRSLDASPGNIQGVANTAVNQRFTGKRRVQVAKKTFPRGKDQVMKKRCGSDEKAVTKEGITDKLSNNRRYLDQKASLVDKTRRQQMSTEHKKQSHVPGSVFTKGDESLEKVTSNDGMTQSSEVPGAVKKKLKHPKTCNKCGKRFPTLLAKTRHMITHAGEKIKCHLCGARFNWRSSLRKHLKWSKCPFQVKVMMKDNEKVKKNSPNIYPLNTKDIVTTIEKKQNSPNDYPLIIKDIVTTIEKVDENRPTVIVSTFIRNAITVVEGFGVSEEKAELTEVGSGPDVGIFRCGVCGNEYTYRSSLKIHMRNHTGEMPYKCNICKKHFRSRKCCRKHVISHGKESSSVEIKAAFEQVMNKEETSPRKVLTLNYTEAEKYGSETTNHDPKQLVIVAKYRRKVDARRGAKGLGRGFGTAETNGVETNKARETNDTDDVKLVSEGESRHIMPDASGSCSNNAVKSTDSAARQHNHFPQKDFHTQGSRKRRRMYKNVIARDLKTTKVGESDSDCDIRGETTKRQRLIPSYECDSKDLFEANRESSEKESSHDEWCEETSPEQFISDDLRYIHSTDDDQREFTTLTAQLHGISEDRGDQDRPSEQLLSVKEENVEEWVTPNEGYAIQGGDASMVPHGGWAARVDGLTEHDRAGMWLNQGDMNQGRGTFVERNLDERLDEDEQDSVAGTGTWVKRNEGATKREGRGSQDIDNGPSQEGKDQFLFQCKVCNAKFTSRFVLRRHEVITGHAKASYECPYCKRIYSEGGAYANHMFVHQRENGMKCDICGKELQSRTTFMNHMALHKKNPITCSLCYELFQNEDTLQEHVNTAHDALKEFKCKYCKKTFDWQSNYSRHLNKHTNKKEFKCKICNYSFNIISNLKRHVLRVHNGQAEGDETSWEAVNPVHQDHVLNRQHQRRDLWQANEDIDDEREVVHRRRGRLKALQSPNRKKYRCNICQFLCSSRMQLTNHLRYGHKKVNNPETALLHFIIEDENFLCQLCGSVIYGRHSLKNHFLRVHKMGLDEDNIAGVTKDGKQLDKGVSYANGAVLSEAQDSHCESKEGKSYEYDVQILDSGDREKRTEETKVEILDSDNNNECLPFIDVEKLSREANSVLLNVGNYNRTSNSPATQGQKDSARPMKPAGSAANCIELDSKEDNDNALHCSLCRVLFKSRDLLVRHLHHFHKIPEGFEEALIELTRDVVKTEPGGSTSRVGIPPKKSRAVHPGTSTASSPTSKTTRKINRTLKCPICDQSFESISALQRHASICDSYMTL